MIVLAVKNENGGKKDITAQSWDILLNQLNNYNWVSFDRDYQMGFEIDGDKGVKKFAITNAIFKDEKDVDFSKNDILQLFRNTNFKFQNCEVMNFGINMRSMNGRILGAENTTFVNVAFLGIRNLKGGSSLTNVVFKNVDTFVTTYKGSGKTNEIIIKNWKNVSFEGVTYLSVDFKGHAKGLKILRTLTAQKTRVEFINTNVENGFHDDVHIEGVDTVLFVGGHSKSIDTPDRNIKIKECVKVELRFAHVIKSQFEVNAFRLESLRFLKGGLRDSTVRIVPSEDTFTSGEYKASVNVSVDYASGQKDIYDGLEFSIDPMTIDSKKKITHDQILFFLSGTSKTMNQDSIKMDDAFLKTFIPDNGGINDSLKFNTIINSNAIKKKLFSKLIMLNMDKEDYNINDYLSQIEILDSFFKFVGIDIDEFDIKNSKEYTDHIKKQAEAI